MEKIKRLQRFLDDRASGGCYVPVRTITLPDGCPALMFTICNCWLEEYGLESLTKILKGCGHYSVNLLDEEMMVLVGNIYDEVEEDDSSSRQNRTRTQTEEQRPEED